MGTFTGSSSDTVLTGTDDADTFFAGPSPDTMVGLDGDDTYYVNDPGDVVLEAIGAGFDTVYASLSWKLQASSEVERIIAAAGTSAINLTGNEFPQELDGNAGVNVLDGGGGADVLLGGKGNDTYIVSDPSVTVVENLGEGNDTIKTSLATYTLPLNVENLTYTGTASFYGVGNDLANVLTANAPGSTLVGGAGDDFYQISQTTTTIVEQPGGGRDTVVATANFILPENVEVLKLFGTGTVSGYTGVGNSGDNVLISDANPSTLIGGAGNDIITGGGGADVFVFDVGSGHDTITDFTSIDHIRLGAGYGVTSFAQVLSQLSQAGSNVVLTLSPVDDVTLQNTTIAQLSAANFELPLDSSGFTLTFNDDFNSLSTYSAITGQGTWMTQFGFRNATGVTVHTLPATGEREIYVDPTYSGTGTTPLGLNPFSLHDGQIDISIANTPSEDIGLLYNRPYTSGLLTTQPTFAQTYGYYEIRAELPQGQGAWPAFWLLPTSGLNPPEVDILEAHGSQPGVIGDTVHDAAYNRGTASTSVFLPDLVNGFHAYGFLWSPQTLTWYIDGMQVMQVATPADMNQPMYMLVNLAVDAFGAITPTSLPSPFSIDYVRAYATVDTVAEMTPLRVFGTSDSDTLIGGSADDLLSGGLGDDVLDGRGGDNTAVYSGAHDRYVLTADTVNGGYWISDLASNALNEGRDHLLNIQNLSFPDGVFSIGRLTNSGAAAVGAAAGQTFLGTPGNDIIVSNEGGATIDGGGGVDTVVYSGPSSQYVIYKDSAGGYDVFDTALPSQPMDRLFNISIISFSDQSVDPSTVTPLLLRGTANADTLVGGTGNDVFYVNNAQDLVHEDAGQGFDTVYTSVPWTVTSGAYVDKIILTGSSNANLIGNGLALELDGNAGINTLADGGGAAVLKGGLGNDTYVVTTSGTQVVENANEGLDTVKTSLNSYTLPDNVENLTFSGTGSFHGVGNATNGTLTGGSGDDTLVSGTGAEKLVGGGGNDTFYINNVNDTVVAAPGGNSVVYTSVSGIIAAANISKLTYTGTGNFTGYANAAGTEIISGAGNDVLVGGGGNDVLDGGAGNNILSGGAGADVFRFNAPATGINRITDFVSGTDHIQLSSAGFQLDPSTGFTFVSGSNPVTIDAHPSVLYNTTTGALYFDPTGADNHDQVQIATLDHHPLLTVNDFIIS